MAQKKAKIVSLLPHNSIKCCKIHREPQIDLILGSYAMGKRKKLVTGLWSKDDVKLLKKLFANRRTQEVADQLGRSLKSVRMKASKMGLKKSKTYLKSLGRK